MIKYNFLYLISGRVFYLYVEIISSNVKVPDFGIQSIIWIYFSKS